MDFWYSFTKGIVRTYVALFMEGVKVDGRENLPPGPKIIVGNHPHVTDSFVLPFIVPEKIHFFIQEETFTLPIIGKILELADQIPVVIGQGCKFPAVELFGVHSTSRVTQIDRTTRSQ